MQYVETTIKAKDLPHIPARDLVPGDYYLSPGWMVLTLVTDVEVVTNTVRTLSNETITHEYRRITAEQVMDARKDDSRTVGADVLFLRLSAPQAEVYRTMLPEIGHEGAAVMALLVA